MGRYIYVHLKGNSRKYFGYCGTLYISRMPLYSLSHNVLIYADVGTTLGHVGNLPFIGCLEDRLKA